MPTEGADVRGALRAAADLTYSSVASFFNVPAPQLIRHPHSQVPPAQRERLAAVRAPPPQAPNASLFFGSLLRPPPSLPALNAELDGLPLGQQSVQRHEQRLHARLHSLSEHQLSRLESSLPARVRRQLHAQLEAANVMLPAIERRDGGIKVSRSWHDDLDALIVERQIHSTMRTSKSAKAISKSTGRLPSLSPSSLAPLPPADKRKAPGFEKANASAPHGASKSLGALKAAKEAGHITVEEYASQSLATLKAAKEAADITVEEYGSALSKLRREQQREEAAREQRAEAARELEETTAPPLARLLMKTLGLPTGVCHVFLEFDVDHLDEARASADPAAMPPVPPPAVPPPSVYRARLSMLPIELASGMCPIRLEISVEDLGVTEPGVVALADSAHNTNRSPNRSPTRSPTRSPPQAGAEQPWRPPPIDTDGLTDEQVVTVLRRSLCRCAGRTLEHFATFDAKNLGSVSRAEFHKGVALLGLSAPSNAIDRLFDMWASPEALLTAPHTTVRDKAAQGAARTSDQLALTDLSGALKRGGAPRHVREAAALHKRIHHDRPIRQAELIPPLPPATEAANLVSADLGILGVKKMDFRASATQHQSVEATASAHDSSESSAIGRLRKAVKRMQVQEKVKEELMSLVGKWSQDKLHLLEGLFQNAEALQMRIETWKQQADPARHRLSAHDAHALFKHLRFSSGADERERLLSTEIIFHDIEESRDVQEGYISLDDLSVTVWQKTNEEIWRMYKDAKLSETVGDGSPGAGASRGGAVVDQLRSALIDQAQRVVALFNSWDKDGDGTITKAEFRRALPELEMWADPEDIDELFDSFDSDGGGSISFRELNRMLRRSRSVDDRKSTKKPSVVLEVADVGALRIEIAKQVRSAAMHAVIDEKLENVPLS